VDRSQHEQDIGLRYYESRSCWFGIAGNLMGVASGGATVAAGSIGVMTPAGQIALTLVEYGSYVVDGVNVDNGLTNIIRRLL
jgi:hypothetical protein